MKMSDLRQTCGVSVNTAWWITLPQRYTSSRTKEWIATAFQTTFIWIKWRILSYHVTYSQLQLCNSGIILAAMHSKENAQRPQKLMKERIHFFYIVYPKHKSGGYSLNKILVDSIYGKWLPTKNNWYKSSKCLSCQYIHFYFFSHAKWLSRQQNGCPSVMRGLSVVDPVKNDYTDRWKATSISAWSILFLFYFNKKISFPSFVSHQQNGRNTYFCLKG